MSSWIIVTLRGLPAKEYEYSRDDYSDPWDATADITASVDDDRRVRAWETYCGHVYAYLTTTDVDDAEAFVNDYEDMLKDAVILRANDTSDAGTAYYYDGGTHMSHKYAETKTAYTGEHALAVMNAKHEIMARDPFHNPEGRLNDRYLEDGMVRVDE
jgi:hypothetical protein